MLVNVFLSIFLSSAALVVSTVFTLIQTFGCAHARVYGSVLTTYLFIRINITRDLENEGKNHAEDYFVTLKPK